MVKISKKKNHSAEADEGIAKAITPLRTIGRVAAFHYEGSNTLGLSVHQNARKNDQYCDRWFEKPIKEVSRSSRSQTAATGNT